MRTTTLLALSLSTAATFVSASPSSDGGSIQALLDRMSHRANRTHSLDHRPSNLPEFPKNETGSSDYRVFPKNETRLPPPAPETAKNGTSEPVKEEGHPRNGTEGPDGPTDKIVKRLRSKKNEDNAKRWVWANSIIQDSTPSSAAPAIGENVNLLSSSTTIPVNTPAATLIAPSFPPRSNSSAVASTSTAAPVVAAVNATTTPAAASTMTRASRPSWHKTVGHGSRREKKRWVWANSIIQDGTPSSAAPSIGVNANLLSSSAAAVTTPSANLVAPSFAPLNSSSSSSTTTAAAPVTTSAAANATVASTSAAANATVSSTTSSAAPASTSAHGVASDAKRMLAEVEAAIEELFHMQQSTSAAAPAATAAALEKRWVWGTSIIQDGTPSSAAPAIGQNVNLLSSATYAVTTPAASTMVAPSFPPLSSSSSASSVDSSATAVPTSSASSLSSSATTTTSRMNRKEQADSMRESLASAASASSAAAAATTSTSSRMNMKDMAASMRAAKDINAAAAVAVTTTTTSTTMTSTTTQATQSTAALEWHLVQNPKAVRMTRMKRH
ncbi:hypothetical protein JCM1840_004845 [Sporobolomyces johnsonii]